MTSLADIIVSGDEGTSGNPNASTATTTTTNDEPSTTSVDADVPEKFRNKSLKDVVSMYENLERDHGRLANELGTQRVLTDRILQIDQKRERDLRANSPSEAPPKVTTDDILNRPNEVLERVTDARTRAAVEPVQDRITQLENALARTRFEARHPDFQSVVNDPAFAQWVQGSPLRTRAAVVANAGNWDVAADLLAEYKNDRQARTSATSTSTTGGNTQLEAARRATLESGSSSGRNTTDDGKKPGERFKRKDLMKLRATDPEAYYDDAYQARVLAAYAESRIDD